MSSSTKILAATYFHAALWAFIYLAWFYSLNNPRRWAEQRDHQHLHFRDEKAEVLGGVTNTAKDTKLVK